MTESSGSRRVSSGRVLASAAALAAAEGGGVVGDETTTDEIAPSSPSAGGALVEGQGGGGGGGPPPPPEEPSKRPGSSLEITKEEEGGGEEEPDKKETALSCCTSWNLDWLCTVMVGVLVASYWRGTWTLLDIWWCDQPGTAGMVNGESFCFAGVPEKSAVRFQTAWQSVLVGYGLLAVGLAAMRQRWWQPRGDKSQRVTVRTAVIRFLMVYILGGGAATLWRGIWDVYDEVVLPDDPVASNWTTAVAGVALCFLLGAGASLLAPPAVFLLDGPSLLPPPLGDAILVACRSVSPPPAQAKARNDKDPTWPVILDMFVSHALLPWGVVGFWRGCWILMDTHLWGFNASTRDLQLSILCSFILGVGCLLIGSEDAVQHVPARSHQHPWLSTWHNQTLGRARTLVLGLGAVDFWRAVWLCWDEWLGKTTVWSAALSHCLGVIGLCFAGCLSCIAAPPATVSVDAIAHPDCADEPSFHNVPVPAEALHILAIGRQPATALGEEDAWHVRTG